MRYCKYSTTLKWEFKRTRILQKGEMRFYRKRRKLSHDSWTLYLENKVFPKFCTQKNGVKNATVTQWQTTMTLYPVRIRAEIIIRLYSYPGTTHKTPLNKVYVEHQEKSSPQCQWKDQLLGSLLTLLPMTNYTAVNGLYYQMNLLGTHTRVYLKLIQWRRSTEQSQNFIIKSISLRAESQYHLQLSRVDINRGFMSFIEQ